MTLFGDDSRIGLAGDWHGNTQWARHALATFGVRGIKTVHQLGDFGLYWPGSSWNQYINEVEGACIRWGITLFVTPGNHENWEAILAQEVADDGVIHVTEHVKILPRGFRWEHGGRTFVSLGGAPSIDFPHRWEGRSWWREEAITLMDVEKVTEGGPADIMLAHDAPENGTEAVQRIIDTPTEQTMWTPQGLRYAEEGRTLMNIAFRAVQPQIFAHGHYHIGDEKWRHGTLYLSLNCDSWGFKDNLIELDLDVLDHQWLDILTEIPSKHDA